MDNELLVVATDVTRGITPGDDIPMTDIEFMRLDILEISISGNWLSIGRDLKEIRESKLYRRTRTGEKQTWAEYCSRIHDRSKQYLDSHIRAVEAMDTLKTETKVSVFPESISQAATLSGLKPEEMAIATENAHSLAKTEHRGVTVKDFKKAAAKFKPKPSVGETTRKSSNGTIRTDQPTGSFGLHVNTVSLVAPVREFFVKSGLDPTSTLTAKGTHFTFEGSAMDQNKFLSALTAVIRDQGPLDMKIILE